jgi:hypothetical protein
MIDPLPDEPTDDMRAVYDMLKGDAAYPVPTGQAALWAVMAGYATDPIIWAQQLLHLTSTLIEEET